MEFDIIIKSNNDAKSQWDEIDPIIKFSFKDAVFNDNYTLNEVRKEVLSDIEGYSSSDIVHLLAINKLGKIIGAVFSLPNIKKPNLDYCSVGWFFTSQYLTIRNRVDVADALINFSHKFLKGIGYDKIITEMGTKQGERLLSKRYGYVRVPMDNNDNRWVKIL